MDILACSNNNNNGQLFQHAQYQKQKPILGVCALDNKARSKPMRNILERLLSTKEIDILIFGDKVILDEPVEHWPTCDFLICFYSRGFPLEKAIEYVEWRKPFCVNDVPLQQLLLDRRLVLMTLDANDIPTPHRLTVSRDNGPILSEVVRMRISRDFGLDLSVHMPIERDITMIDHDTISVNGRILKKPFAEKPVSGENHQIYIYYPSDGIRKLFRKIGNKSSEYISDEWQVRNDGSYIYEEFMCVDQAEDVKVYTIGPHHAYAETRKSPVVDGIVRRNTEGKELRYITTLSEEEQEIARRVCMAFGQTICGFDLLRVNGKSYVIDVNGWSFVKGNEQYYDMCANILRETFLRVSKKSRSIQSPKEYLLIQENQWQLKRYISVLRHADRTPKQKIKIYLQDVIDHYIPYLKNGIEIMIRNPSELRSILAQSLKLLHKLPPNSSDSDKLKQLCDILSKKLRHADTKLQLKPVYENKSIIKILIVVKWGGEFTHAGRHHAKDLAENLRKDLFLINKNLLDSWKFYSSSERRVVATSEIFAKAFIPLAELPAGMIRIDKEMLDDNILAKEEMESVKSKLQQMLQMDHLHSELEELGCFPQDLNNPKKFIQETIRILQHHYVLFVRNKSCLKGISSENLRSSGPSMDVDDPVLGHKWCCFDSHFLWQERWEKLFRDICEQNNSTDCSLDPSKISELYDSIKYDIIHNREYIFYMFTYDQSLGECTNANLESFHDLFRRSKYLFDYIAPLEYGITLQERLNIGRLITNSLVERLVKDLHDARISSSSGCIFYFTKESHVYPLVNVVLYCGLTNTKLKDLNMAEMDYLAQIILEVYERRAPIDGGIDGYGMHEDGTLSINREKGSEFALRLALSPGATDASIIDLQMIDSKHVLSVAPRRWITEYINLDDAIRLLSEGNIMSNIQG